MQADYAKLMGVEGLALSSGKGKGVTIAILDSGCPKPDCLPSCTSIGHEGCLDDEFGHATAVASLLFGGNGIRGVCEGALPLYVKVLDDSGHGSIGSVTDGIYKALEFDADIINLSLGFLRTDKCPRALKKACRRVFEAGKTIICAAGNDGGPVNWPAALDCTISVGSAGENGLKTSFSSIGEVDFVAPGLGLRVLDPKGQVKTASGTSFSSALVAGVCALLVADGKSADLETMKGALRSMATDVDAKGWDMATGYGLISGRNSCSDVCLKIKPGFFDRILSKIQGFCGLGNKGDSNGSRV